VNGHDRRASVATARGLGDDRSVARLSQMPAEQAPGLIERGEQLAALEDALAGVRLDARGRLALIRGEAGIGKTALLTRFCAGAGPSVRLLWAACDPLFTPRPLGPLLDIARATGGELNERVVRGDKPHDVANALLRELEAPSPTVLVLEDVHWADEATLDVTRLVARRVEETPAMLVASYRDEELSPTHPLRVVLGELPPNGAVTRLELPALSREAVSAMAAQGDVDADELYARTDGNPFFVTEALAAGAAEVPHTVRDAVHARAARLSPPARALLDASATIPERAELWLLEALVGGTVGDIGECLSSGMLIGAGDRVGFRHELARLAIEESLAPDRRLGFHRRALAALADRKETATDLARLAHHAEGAADTDAVLRLAPAAAEQAAAVGARREALAQYERALRFSRGLAPEERADLLEAFAEEAYVIDMREEAVTAFDEALAIRRAAGDLIGQGALLVRKARTIACMGRTPEAKILELEAVELLEQVPPSGALARAYGAVAADRLFNDDTQEAIDWGGRAIDLAERMGNQQALIYSLNTVGTAEIVSGRPGGREKLERSIELGKAADLGVEVGRGYLNLMAAFGTRREWKEANAYLEPGIEYCRERGLEAWLECLVAGQAESWLFQGRWDDAAEAATSLLNGRPSSVLEPRLGGLLILGLVRARRGEPEVWPLLDEAVERATPAEGLQVIGPVVAARAEACWLEGRHDAVGHESESAIALAHEVGEPYSLGELAVWRRRAGIEETIDAEVAPPYAAELAGEHERAAAAWIELGSQYGAALALSGADNEEALRRSLDELQRLGAEPAAAIVARRLRERGVRRVPRGPRTSTKENPAGLTAREVEVLELVAEGLRNAEIAERLFLSEKTVGHHVSSILGKLEVPSRGQASVEAQRLGIIDVQE
jgi:DNA-binding CsgD family transcriptional regulator/tetratricopeptide (TPR) repeat protein